MTAAFGERAEAYRSQDSFEAFLPEAFGRLLGPRLPEAERAWRSGDEAALKRIESEANALGAEPGDLEQADALLLEPGRSRGPAAALQARELLLSGGYAPQFLFSGAATRLGLGSMYVVDLRTLAEEIRSRRHGLVLESFEGLPQPFRSAITGAPVPRFSLGLGPRQLLEYRSRLETLAAAAGVSPERAVRAAAFVLHLGQRSEEAVLDDLVENDFYGFDPDKALFLTQPMGHGLLFKEGGLVQDPESVRLPAGHGYPMAQLFQRGTGFRLDAAGRRRPLDGTVEEELRRLGVKLLGSHRVNDLDRLEAAAADPVRLGLGLELMGDLDDPGSGHNFIVELVDNPKNQKGGFWKRDKRTGIKALAESMNLKTPELAAFSGSLKNAPYNSFRNLYKLSSLGEVLSGSGFFTPFVRFRGGRLYPETITGEATGYPGFRTEAFRLAGQLIHDFKELSDLPEALDFASRQESVPAFAALAEKYSRA